MRLSLASPWLVLSLLVAGAAAAVEAPDLDTEQRVRLDRGDVIVLEASPTNGEGFAYRSFGVVDAPSARVWPVVSDCGDLDEFMPRMIRADQFDEQGTSYVCETEIELPFPLSNRTNAARSFLEELPGGIFRRQWSLVPGDWDWHRNDGSWTVWPWGEALDRTLLEYKMDAWLKTRLPDFVLDAAQSIQAPAAFDAIRARVRSKSNGVAAPPPTDRD
ncbi:MAG: hypothetical protein CL910_00500 [Deltaproteobacteria bacterium]|jgi:hypothetical protein|nr:hypothetical protein [Deltaproteobacteria bacterium]